MTPTATVNRTSRRPCSELRASGAVLVVWFCLGSPLQGHSASEGSSLAPAASNSEHMIVVMIRARTFEPATIRLTAGRRTNLVFENHDVELHAFVPGALLSGVHMNIAGNGAPEFGSHGLKRVIIPSNGRAEIRFVPERSGSYPFLCDMPGHEMQGTIVVQPSGPE